MSGRILVAGIGNIFLGDDGFGVEVVKELAGHDLPDGVEVKDFGIKGMDLAYALMDDYEAVVFVDAVPRGGEPGTVYLIEAEVPEEGEVALDTHGMDPVKVIRLARILGAEVPRTLVVGCEPKVILSGEAYDDMLMELSEPVRAAVPEAVKMLESLLKELSTKTPVKRPEAFSRGGEIVKKLLFLGVVAGAAYAVAAQWPDIQRYMKMRNM